MYEPSPDFARLRQGDVISNIYLPRFSPSNSSFIYKFSNAGELDFNDEAISRVKLNYAVVLSQCCEFNEGKRKAFTISTLLTLKESLKKGISVWGINVCELVAVVNSPFRGKKGRELDSVEKLRSANRLDPEKGKNEALNVFLFESEDKHLTSPHVADFTRVTSISMSEHDFVLNNKLLQLNSEHRRLFQIKLAYFYGRQV